MMIELIRFFTPPRQLARVALASAAFSAAWLLLRLPALPAIYLAIPAGILFSGSLPDLAILPVTACERAWPLSERSLGWGRLLAVWLVGWVPILACAAAASAVWALGALVSSAWVDLAFHAVCLLGVAPLAAGLACRIQRHIGLVNGMVIVMLPLGIAVATLAHVSRAGAPPAAASVPLAPLLTRALPIALVAAVLGALLAWSRAAAPARAPTLPAKQLLPALTPNAEQLAQAEAEPLAARAARRFAVARFFYFNSRGPFAWFAWFQLCTAVLGYRDEIQLTQWFTLSWLWFFIYLGYVGGRPLPAHLPVSRERMFAYLLGPIAIAGALALALEARRAEPALAAKVYRADRDSFSAAAQPPAYNLAVPNDHWRVVWGEPPLVRAPSGVTRRPSAYAVVGAGPLCVYNPYEARLDDDTGFVAYQISRALSDYVQVELNAEDVLRACAPAPGKGAEHWSNCLGSVFGGPSLRPAVTFPLKAWLLGAAVALAFAPSVLSRGPRGSFPLSQKIAAIAWLPGLALLFALDSLGHSDPTGLWSSLFPLSVLLAQLLRFLEPAPLLAALAAFGALVLMYWGLLRRFQRVELTQRPSAFSGAKEKRT